MKKLVSSGIEPSHIQQRLSPKSGIVSSLKKDCEMFIQNRPLSFAASQTRSQFTSPTRHTDWCWPACSNINCPSIKEIDFFIAFREALALPISLRIRAVKLVFSLESRKFNEREVVGILTNKSVKGSGGDGVIIRS